MRPHEQTWTYEPERYGFFGHHRHVDAAGALIPAPLGVKGDDVEPILRFIAAAPAMARALLAQGYESKGEWHTAVCWEYTGGDAAKCWDACRDARDALRKAGALP